MLHLMDLGSEIEESIRKTSGDLEEISYCGFFINEIGDRWILLYDIDKDKGLLYGDDLGWDNPIEVPVVDEDLVFCIEEVEWLDSCMIAIHKYQEIEIDYC